LCALDSLGSELGKLVGGCGYPYDRPNVLSDSIKWGQISLSMWGIITISRTATSR